MAIHKKISCGNCKKPIYRSASRFNENMKLGWNFFCSKKCEYKYRTKRQLIVCENCGKNFSRTPNEMSTHNYCSRSCAAIINNKIRPKIKAQMKICSNCGGKFKKSIGNTKYCSMKCRQEAKLYTPEQLLNIIKQLAQKLKSVPPRREMEKIVKPCIKTFGSWNNAILAAGFNPNRSHDDRMYKRAKAKAIDGHLCDSISELLIDNWLYKNSILHERDARYPKTHHKTDWRIFTKDKEAFVEYFGLANDSPRYDRSIKQKEMLCKKHGISLVEIYPKDIYPQDYLENNLKNKFRDFLNP